VRKQLLALVAAALVTGVLAGAAQASHSWGNYHWARTSNPFTLTVVDTTNGVWPSHTSTAVNDWARSSVLDLVLTRGSADRRCKAISGKVKVCNNTYGFNGWLGLATISISGGVHITAGTTKLNDSYFNTASYNSPTKRQHVACQEIGHDFGLGHQDESGADLNTCMDYSSALDNPSPNAHDYEQLETIYNSHLDSGTTISMGLAGSEHAQPVAVERNDRITNSVITERFADGTYLVTHITWALDGPGRS
jgi:hypothetical protein